MARHRWATGEHPQGADRLDRVLNLNRAGSQPAGIEATGGEDYPLDEYSGGPTDGGTAEPHHQAAAARRRSGRRWAATRRAALLAAGCALAVGGWQFVTTDRNPGHVVPIGSSIPSGDAAPPPDSSVPDSPAAKGAVAEGAAAEGAVGPNHTPGKHPPAAGHGAEAASVVVHIAGAVQSPGVVETATGSRVFEVLEKAGGALPEAELSAVNLAAVVQDGQQILIPRAGDPPMTDPARAPAAAPNTSSGPDALLNLNTADATDLEDLPRVGPVLAERIVQWRSQHGPFTRPEDLDAVPGIGPAMLESLLPLVTV